MIERSDGFRNDVCFLLTGANEVIGRQLVIDIEKMNSSSGEIKIDLFLKKLGMANYLGCYQRDAGTANPFSYFAFCSQGFYWPEEKNTHDLLVFKTAEDLEPIHAMELTV